MLNFEETKKQHLAVKETNELWLRPAAEIFIERLDDPETSKSWGSVAIKSVLEKVLSAEAAAQKAVDQIGVIKDNKDLTKEAVVLRAMDANLAAQAAIAEKFEEINKTIEATGRKAAAEAFPKKPGAEDKTLQLAEIEAIKSDIRMRLDPINDRDIEDRYAKLLAWHKEKGNDLAVWLLASDWAEQYFDSRMMPLPAHKRWAAYAPFASEQERWSASMAIQFGNMDLLPQNERHPDKLSRSIVEAIQLSNRGLTRILGA